jgi:mono/diheme cytochrome c family protein
MLNEQRFLTTLAVILVLTASGSIAASISGETALQRDDARARAAFLAIIPVLKHPRCLNCHANGDYPRQGDDSHVHTQSIRRGPFGHGVTSQKCSACHQTQNVAGLNQPPGAPNWHLPPPNMPMIWEGKTPGQICQQMKDPKQNHSKSVAAIVEHVTSDELVLWGWNPGEGRTPPPMSHDEFAAKFAEWARYGAACPE